MWNCSTNGGNELEEENRRDGKNDGLVKKEGKCKCAHQCMIYWTA